MIKTELLLTALNAQGKLNSESTRTYYSLLDSGAIDTVDKLKAISSTFNDIAKTTSKSDNWSNGIENLRNEANNLINTFDKLQSRSDVDFNTTQLQTLKSQLTALRDVDIFNDADLANANKELSKLKSTMSTVKDEVSKSDSAMERFDNILKKIYRSGLNVGDVLADSRMQVQLMNNQDITLDENYKAAKAIK